MLVIIGVPVTALAVGSYTWGPSVPNYDPSVVIDSGMIDVTTIPNFATGVLSPTLTTGYSQSGNSGALVGWDDTWTGISDPAKVAGNSLDGDWVQIRNGVGVWVLGAPKRTIWVFPSEDHGPYLAEGLEFKIYGSNDGVTKHSTATLKTVYLDGWRPFNASEDANRNLWCGDDVASKWDLGGFYRYVILEPWATSGPLSEPEIDAIGYSCSEIPLPGSLLLLGSGLVALASLRRK